VFVFIVFSCFNILLRVSVLRSGVIKIYDCMFVSLTGWRLVCSLRELFLSGVTFIP